MPSGFRAVEAHGNIEALLKIPDVNIGVLGDIRHSIGDGKAHRWMPPSDLLYESTYIRILRNQCQRDQNAPCYSARLRTTTQAAGLNVSNSLVQLATLYLSGLLTYVTQNPKVCQGPISYENL